MRKNLNSKARVLIAESVDQLSAMLDEEIKLNITPSLAVVFSSVIHDLEAVRSVFSTRGIEVFGASTAGEIVNDEIYEEAIAVMLLDIPSYAFQINLFEAGEQTPFQLGEQVAIWAKAFHDNPSIMVMNGGIHADGEQIVKGIIDKSGDATNLFGCVASYDPVIMYDNPETYAFSASKSSSNGIVALAFNPDVVEVKGVGAGGWKGIGTPKTLTDVQGNRVYQIDDTPALDVINKYLNIGEETELAMEYPLLFKREDGSWAMRTVFGINSDKSIILSGSFPKDTKVQFGMSPGPDIISHTIEKMSRFNNSNPGGEALILYSCRARYMSLGPMIKEEISAVNEIFNMPTAGFFTFGEIGPGHGGTCGFHNQVLMSVRIDW